MEYRRIGELEASVVGLGCNNFGMRIDSAATAAVVDAAIDAGINYFDTAEGYGNGLSEEYLGAALKGRRDRVLIATKWGMLPTPDDDPPTGSAEAVRAAVEASLTRLGTDHIDHYQYHRPDGRTPVAETLGALAELVAEGKVREIGCSNFSEAQLDEAEQVAAEGGIPRFVTVQNHYSLLTRDPETDGVLEACGRHGIGFVPFFPLESGVLTGKYTFGEAAPEGTRLASMGERAQSLEQAREALEMLVGWRLLLGTTGLSVLAWGCEALGTLWVIRAFEGAAATLSEAAFVFSFSI